MFFDDCVLSLGNSAQSIFLQYARGRFNGCSLAGTAPTTLFKTSIGTGFDFIIESCSLDGVAYTNLFDQSVATPGRLLIRNSRVSTQTITGTHAGVGASVVQLHNCASGDVHVNLSRQEALGATDVETTLVRSGGGATSYRMTASTSTAYPHLILWSPEASIYNSTTGSAQTLTVEILRDSATNLQDDEVFLEVQYQGTSGYPQAIELTDAISDPLGTPADQTSSSETWTTTGMSNPNKQKLAVTFTAQETGYIHYRVGNSSGSATPIYVDLLGATLA